jgi:hypothetical protein
MALGPCLFLVLSLEINLSFTPGSRHTITFSQEAINQFI